MIRQLARFGAVGIAAMAVHWLVVMALVPLGLLPLIANVIAFAVAFNVSYLGHRNWTFADSGDTATIRAVDNAATDKTPSTPRGHGTTLKRFFMVSLTSFALNEFMYYLLLRFTALDYRSALAIVLFAVAALTFVLSRYWAFRQP